MKIQIFTDNWYPQVSGIVTSTANTVRCLEEFGHEVDVVHPGMFITLPWPFYTDIKLAWFASRTVERLIKEYKPDVIHAMTEGPLGFWARKYCNKNNIPYTTSFHTRIPDYFTAYFGIPADWTYRYFHMFHRHSSRILVPATNLYKELERRGFKNIQICPPGVDTALFKPMASEEDKLFPGDEPVIMYVGRVALEKNMPAFFDLKVPGRKIVVGDGPMLNEYKKKYPHVEFLGAKHGVDLAHHYASADVMVCPSRTETYGLVMIEALACGTPVAAFPVPGPLDVIRSPEVGVLNEDLNLAVEMAMKLSRKKCREYALEHSWEKSTRKFESFLINNSISTAKSSAS